MTSTVSPSTSTFGVMDELELLVRDVLAAAEPALTSSWRQLIADTRAENDDVTVVNAALEAMAEGGEPISPELRDRVITVIVEGPEAQMHEGRRVARSLSNVSVAATT